MDKLIREIKRKKYKTEYKNILFEKSEKPISVHPVLCLVFLPLLYFWNSFQDK
ncbi:unnamed protein product [Gulo gulo]|uniref:Uncharacterized protein n=1 Tax=Gulo gulo TaxID=48420 RepID=A0A9X9M2Z5_GULGU|nr:unnamed protein product [Gulo gulo]